MRWRSAKIDSERRPALYIVVPGVSVAGNLFR